MTADERKTVFEAWLASAELPYEVIVPLFHGYKDAEQVHDAVFRGDPDAAGQLSPAQRARLNRLGDRDQLNQMYLLIRNHAIRSVNIEQENYPSRLRDIPDPPAILFWQGNPEVFEGGRIAAVIGSRAASYTGLKAARTVSRALSCAGVTIISGLAYGIDSECHRGCLDGGSPTVAVSGRGLDEVYPSGNRELRDEILRKGGLTVSEYAPGIKPYGFHFPVRNRIISGMSDAVILMEGKIRSGSMSTVDHALRQGREVFAYPGEPGSPMYEGNRALLRDGAHFFSAAVDILEDMNWLDNPSVVGQNSDCHAEVKAEGSAETAVFQALAKGGLAFEQLVSVTGLPSSELMSTLTMLSLKGLIENLPGKRYMLKN